MIEREITDILKRDATLYPVITLLGPRQAGKTTLARQCFSKYGYVNLEDPPTRELIEVEIDGTEAFKATNGYVKGSVKDRIPSGSSYAILMNGGSPVCVYSIKENKIICQVHNED